VRLAINLPVVLKSVAVNRCRGVFAMIIETLEKAVLLKRYKRFLADVEFGDGKTATIHCPNPGSMIGVAEPGSTIWLRRAKPGRKLDYTWVLTEVSDRFVCVDTLMANRLLYLGLTGGCFASVLPYSDVNKERTFGDSRFDFYLANAEAPHAGCYMEVKSTTLVIDEAAMFPDAVTARGLRHLHGLEAAIKLGFRAVQFYCLARSDVKEFRPADHIDVDYGKALRQASRNNVDVLAWTMDIKKVGSDTFIFDVGARVPVVLA
jgi:sugar fermentation stimulation protein A